MSGHIDCLDTNTQHPEYCHIQSVMKPSVKPGGYHVWLLLGRDGPCASIQCATCECAAGCMPFVDFVVLWLYVSRFRISASCTYISAPPDALVSLTASQFQLQPTGFSEVLLGADDGNCACNISNWKQPRKRKESITQWQKQY